MILIGHTFVRLGRDSRDFVFHTRVRFTRRRRVHREQYVIMILCERARAQHTRAVLQLPLY